MASERLRAYAEAVRGGARQADAARRAGYAETTVRARLHDLSVRAIAAGMLPNPEVDRQAVADHEAAVEAFMAQLRAELPTAGAMLIDVMKGNSVSKDAEGNDIPLTADQRWALLEFMNRVVGRPAIHIHGHKDQAELDAEQHRTIRIINEAAR